MRIIDARIEYDTLCLSSDDTGTGYPPDVSEFTFEEVEPNLYYGTHPLGFVRLFAHNLKSEYGYGGRIFELTMKDGSARSIKGPWSSRPGVFNGMGMPHCVDVIFDGVSTRVNKNQLAEWIEPFGLMLEAYRPFKDDETDGPYYRAIKE